MSLGVCFGALILSFTHVAMAQGWQRPTVVPEQTSSQARPADTLPATACQPPLEGERTVAGLRISESAYQDVRSRASVIATKLIEVTKNPRSTVAVQLDESFARDRSVQDRAARFIGDNNLFNRFVADGEKINPAMHQVRGSMDEFIESLDELKGLTGTKIKVLRALGKIPGANRVIGPDPISRVVTINQHIEQIGRTIDSGIGLMNTNISELSKLQEATFTEIVAMEREIIYMDVLIKEIERLYQEDPEFEQNTQLVERMKFQVLRRLETYGLDQKGLMSVLVASTEGIKHQIAVHYGVIDNANSLRRVAAPAIGITLAVRIAAEDAKRVMGDNERIRARVRQSIEQMTIAIGQSQEQLVQLYKNEVLPAVFMAGEMKKIADARNKFETEMAKIYETKREQSRKYDPVLENGRRVLEAQSVGLRMDLIMGNEGGADSLKPR